MNKTIFIDSGKINDTQFYIDVLYYNATSYRSSLYPTITRLFKKYAMQYMKGGSYTSEEKNIDIPCHIEGYHSKGSNPYSIKRTIYTLK